MKNLYVVTHAESLHHVQGVVGGWHDTELTATGRLQAQKVAQHLLASHPAMVPRIVSSDLKRARQTAEAIGQAFGVELEETRLLRELSYGLAEGKPQAFLDDRLVVAPEDNRLDHRNIEGAESKREFLARIYEATDQAVHSEATDQVIVTHGYALTFVVACWIGMPEASAGWVNFKATPAGVTHLQQDDFFRNRTVCYLNRTDHLLV